MPQQNTVTTESQPQHAAPAFIPLDQETRAGITTREAAHHLNRQMQTLHIWASKENGPIRPTRISGRLVWSVAEIKKLLGMEG